MAAFFRWLGTTEGRSVRYPLIGLALIALFVTAISAGSHRGPEGSKRFDDGWVIVRPCGPILCAAARPGATREVCGEYLLKRDKQGHYWRTNSTFRDEVDQDAIDIVCPLSKKGSG